MDFLRLYLVPTLSFGLLGTVSGMSWSGAMSTSGRLSGWFMNLAALLIGLGFNSQSLEGCLLQLLVLPFIWFLQLLTKGMSV